METVRQSVSDIVVTQRATYIKLFISWLHAQADYTHRQIHRQITHTHRASIVCSRLRGLSAFAVNYKQRRTIWYWKINFCQYSELKLQLVQRLTEKYMRKAIKLKHKCNLNNIKNILWLNKLSKIVKLLVSWVCSWFPIR